MFTVLFFNGLCTNNMFMVLQVVVEVNSEPIISSHPHDNIVSSLNIVNLDLLTHC